MCGLGPFADAIVGSLGVEQRKRTTIGVELAAKVELSLFLTRYVTHCAYSLSCCCFWMSRPLVWIHRVPGPLSHF